VEEAFEEGQGTQRAVEPVTCKEGMKFEMGAETRVCVRVVFVTVVRFSPNLERIKFRIEIPEFVLANRRADRATTMGAPQGFENA
jgi:hypothetical protein